MEPGDLRHRVTLQRRVSTRDAIGGEIYTWVDERTVWGAAEPLTGRELLAAQAKHAEITMRFRVRYMRDVTSNWRLIWEGAIYNILSVTDIDARHWQLELDCSTGLRDG